MHFTVYIATGIKILRSIYNIAFKQELVFNVSVAPDRGVGVGGYLGFLKEKGGFFLHASPV